jgi:hypothetical protein
MVAITHSTKRVNVIPVTLGGSNDLGHGVAKGPFVFSDLDAEAIGASDLIG